jgi:hypothetical protein
MAMLITKRISPSSTRRPAITTQLPNPQGAGVVVNSCRFLISGEQRIKRGGVEFDRAGVAGGDLIVVASNDNDSEDSTDHAVDARRPHQFPVRSPSCVSDEDPLNVIESPIWKIDRVRAAGDWTVGGLRFGQQKANGVRICRDFFAGRSSRRRCRRAARSGERQLQHPIGRKPHARRGWPSHNPRHLSAPA